eukprot:CAMPEP_0115727872 /NCGR_PEP_ID=MMETSP0272-20121206/82657_1 /TAXON_ID=71861 /ORGANISM="Scrippsiella trochoidea, Strain CCMP3099" /LENGTH=61 /DNA_ID=CAMNT_0003171419 /DNA_START=44 /DNA_END=225 /DNA_ORIENTATION=-
MAEDVVEPSRDTQGNSSSFEFILEQRAFSLLEASWHGAWVGRIVTGQPSANHEAERNKWHE